MYFESLIGRAGGGGDGDCDSADRAQDELDKAGMESFRCLGGRSGGFSGTGGVKGLDNKFLGVLGVPSSATSSTGEGTSIFNPSSLDFDELLLHAFLAGTV